MDNTNAKPSWLFRNAANFITLMGFPLCIVLLWVIVVHRDWTMTIFLLVTGVILTDWFDGITARYISGTSKFGGAIDRLRDKLLLGIMFLFLILDGRIHLSLKIITVPLAVIEMALLVYWFMGVRRKMDVSTNKSINKYGHGQIKMLLCLSNIIVEEHWGQKYHLFSTIFLNLMFAISLFFAVKSFLGNRAKYRRQLLAQNGQA